MKKFNKKILASQNTISNQQIELLHKEARQLLLTANSANYQQAQFILQQLVELRPENSDLLNDLGVCLYKQAQYSQAEKYFKKALIFAPNSISVLSSLATVNTLQHKYVAAITYCNKVLGKEPKNIQLRHQLAILYEIIGENSKAYQVWHSLHRLCPDMLQPYLAMGRYYQTINEYSKAEECLLIVWNGSQDKDLQADAASLLGQLYLTLGDIQQALNYVKQAIHLNPRNPFLFSQLLFCIYADPAISPEDVFAYHQQYGQYFMDDFTPLEPKFNNLQEIEKKIRIGYVSGDFKQHSTIGTFIWLIEYCTKDEFDIYAYANNPISDETGKRIREHMGKNWRNIVEKSDEDVFHLIQQDKIDILVDLSGHTHGNRLGVFARKPAPIQVSGLGWGSTTGIKAMDYRITDKYVVPPQYHRLNTEKILYVSSFLHFTITPQRLKDSVLPLPYLDNKYITFGFGNNPFKLNAHFIKRIAEILHQVPNSKFHMKYTNLDHPIVRTFFENQFKQNRLSPERLIFTGNTDTQEHLQFYNQVDIVLDPFPYNGGMSTLDALWMGRPVVTLAGGTRVGISILNNFGHPEWIAHNEEEYVEIAVGLARNIQTVETIRPHFREQMLASHLCKGLEFVAEVEQLYRQIWKDWCFNNYPLQKIYQEALEYHQQNNYVEAKKLYQQIINTDPHHADALHGLGLVAYANNQPEQALSLIQQAHVANPQAPHYLINLAHINYELGNIQDSINLYQQALNINPHIPEVHYRLGEIFLNNQLPLAALTHYQFLVEHVNPQDPGLHNTIANLYRETGNMAAALPHYQKALELKPDYATAHYNFACWHLMQNDTQSARIHLNKAIEFSPNFEPALQLLQKIL